MCNFITATKRHAALLQSSGLDVVPSGPLWARAALCVCCASLVLFAYDVQIFCFHVLHMVLQCLFFISLSDVSAK